MTAFDVTEFDTKAALQDAAADWTLSQIEIALSARGSATLFGAGGSTPGPVYERLSKADLNWGAVTIALTDERWVAPDHSASNEGLIRRTFLKDQAHAASFLSMVSDTMRDPFAETPIIEARYASAAKKPDIAIVGMGPDAHTLSWFPGAKGLDAALDPDTPASVTAIEANPSAVTGDYLQRMTLTLPVMARTRQVLLLITGNDKRSVFETAGPETPIARLVAATQQNLTVFWCP